MLKLASIFQSKQPQVTLILLLSIATLSAQMVTLLNNQGTSLEKSANSSHFSSADPNKSEPEQDNYDDELNPASVRCGTVPMLEKIYSRSFNESEVKNGDQSGETRILHGLDAVSGEWPWIVRLRVCNAAGRCSLCSGTLLSSRWLISAGHCGFNQTAERISATLALYDLISPDSSSFSVAVDKLIVHPDYGEMNNDLALFRLARPVEFNQFVQPACLVGPTRNVLATTEGKVCYTVGFGMTAGMVNAVRLQKLRVIARQPAECNSDTLGSIKLRSGTVCIGPLTGQIGGSCKGDSGGPDLCYDRLVNRWFIFGTVSYGPSDCDRESGESWLTVSVDLSSYRSWILATIKADKQEQVS